MTPKLCEHKEQVTDVHEGTVICLSCGLVLDDKLYIDEIEENKKENTIHIVNNDMKEILNRLNCSYNIVDDTGCKQVFDLYRNINETSSVSLKEFCAVTGLTAKLVVKKNKEKICLIDFEMLLEKYCKIFNLDFKTYTVIKEIIKSKPHSGHPPLTIIGYHIYEYMKKTLKNKISIKNICQAVGISPISLQRYRKHELSFRT